MRPINLIPEQERRRDGGAGRTGPLAFIVVGALLIALAGVVALVITNNQVSERESEVTSLQVRTAVAKQRADRLAPFTSFNEVKRQRTQTITELADNRFDWARVLHELALVMPRWVVLTKITGTSGIGGSEGAESGETGIGSSVKGPALTVYGCGKSQTRVAQMVTALKRIDGVTRVGLSKSVLRFPTEGSSNESGGSENGAECSGTSYAFEAVAAFDAAPLPVESSGAAAEPAATEPEASESSEGESSTSNETTSTGSTTKTTSESIPPKS